MNLDSVPVRDIGSVADVPQDSIPMGIPQDTWGYHRIHGIPQDTTGYHRIHGDPLIPQDDKSQMTQSFPRYCC